MFEYGLSKKQCGVLFGAIKRGVINVPEGFIEWMYDVICESKVLANSQDAEYRKTMKMAVNYLFDGNVEECEAACLNAYGRYNVMHKN